MVMVTGKARHSGDHRVPHRQATATGRLDRRLPPLPRRPPGTSWAPVVEVVRRGGAALLSS
jgi:hypothetical protein